MWSTEPSIPAKAIATWTVLMNVYLTAECWRSVSQQSVGQSVFNHCAALTESQTLGSAIYSKKLYFVFSKWQEWFMCGSLGLYASSYAASSGWRRNLETWERRLERQRERFTQGFYDLEGTCTMHKILFTRSFLGVVYSKYRQLYSVNMTKCRVHIMISTRQGIYMLRKYQESIHMWYNSLYFSIHAIIRHEYCVWHAIYLHVYSVDIRVLKLHVEFLIAKGTKQYM